MKNKALGCGQFCRFIEQDENLFIQDVRLFKSPQNLEHTSLHYGFRAMGAMTEGRKEEELECKSHQKSNIWPSAASKNEVRYLENIFLDFRSVFST